jgi:hypothetical protein
MKLRPFLPLLPSRAPALAPRRRAVEPAVARALCASIRETLHAASNVEVALSEWVSMDSRSVPHAVLVVVGSGSDSLAFQIDKACERILAADVRAAVAPHVPAEESP